MQPETVSLSLTRKNAIVSMESVRSRRSETEASMRSMLVSELKFARKFDQRQPVIVLVA